MRKRWKPSRLTLREFELRKRRIATRQQGRQQRVLRVAGLQQHFARCLRAAGAAADLDEQLGQFLRARKSALNRPSSMVTMMTSESWARSWPLASIWMPIIRPAPWPRVAKWRARSAWSRAVSLSMRTRGTSGKRSTRATSTRSVPAPCGIRARLLQSGQALGARSRWPQWWQIRRPRPCRVRAASQRLQLVSAASAGSVIGIKDATKLDLTPLLLDPVAPPLRCAVRDCVRLPARPHSVPARPPRPGPGHAPARAPPCPDGLQHAEPPPRSFP